MPKCNCLNLYKTAQKVLCKDEKMLICILKNAKKQCLMEDVYLKNREKELRGCVLMLTGVPFLIIKIGRRDVHNNHASNQLS
jgi:hypothetical protein